MQMTLEQTEKLRLAEERFLKEIHPETWQKEVAEVADQILRNQRRSFPGRIGCDVLYRTAWRTFAQQNAQGILIDRIGIKSDGKDLDRYYQIREEFLPGVFGGEA